MAYKENYDNMAAAVSELSGGENVVLMDDMDKPGIYVPIPKMLNSELIKGGSSNVHPAFMVGGVEKPCFYYSKYQNVVINKRAYSLARRDPATYVTYDQAKTYCDNKGAGFHLSSQAEWAAIALLTRMMGTMPHGNNQFGHDSAYPYEKGQEASHEGSGDTYKINRVLTGSGPATWGHDHTKFGIQDLNGNIWEWQTGLRLVDGEIQIIPYNNAALGADCDTGSSSTLWKAISKSGSLVTPGTAGTLKYGASNSLVTAKPDTSVTNWSSFAAMGIESGLTAPELAKALILYPDEPNGDYGGDYHGWNCQGERVAYCGGRWAIEGNAGVFYVDLYDPRSDSVGFVGFRSAFIA